MGIFERYFLVWVTLCIITGVALGNIFPTLFQEITLFGLNSGAALATVVGVLVEVPVMLSLVYFTNRTRNWFS